MCTFLKKTGKHTGQDSPGREIGPVRRFACTQHSQNTSMPPARWNTYIFQNSSGHLKTLAARMVM